LKLCPKIIIEGTRLTHKTDIAFALNEHPRIVGPRKYRYHSPVVSAEWCGFTNEPWGRGLINFEPEEAELAMETYRTWARLFDLLKYYSWIVDRFHISTMVHQAALGREYGFGWLEEHLLPLGFCIVLCTRSAHTFEAAREERLEVSGKPGQYDDLEVFIDEQAAFRQLISKSTLPHIEIDVTGGDISGACNEIADFLDDRGLMSIRD
jgi:hypothetical protein